MKQNETSRLLAGGCILIMVVVFNAHWSPDARGAGPITGGIPLEIRQTAYCSAFTPADWTLWTDSTASTAGAVSADRTMYSGWSMVAVNQALRPSYGDLHGSPQKSIQFITNQILRNILGESGRMRYTSYLRPFLDYFTLTHFESDDSVGLVFYKIYPGASSRTYTESAYWAIAKKSTRQAGLKTAAGVAVSIRCITQIRTSPQGWALPMDPRLARPGCGAGEALVGYQKELGIQFAHSPVTKQNFLMDPATQWNETGPQGPGYYQRVGTGLEKLQLGWHDDC